MRRAARIDENQPGIVKALVDMGASVQLLHAVGGGCPDLLIGWKHKNFLIEIKNPKKPKADQRLTPQQVYWHNGWAGKKAVARTLEEVIAIINCNGSGAVIGK